MQLAIERHLLQNLAAVGLEGGAEVMNIDAAQSGHEPVRNPRRNAAHPEIVDASFAPAADNIVTGGNLLQENWNVGRIVLQIAIHGDNVFAARMIETGRQPSRLAEIAAEFHYCNAAVY